MGRKGDFGYTVRFRSRWRSRCPVGMKPMRLLLHPLKVCDTSNLDVPNRSFRKLVGYYAQQIWHQPCMVAIPVYGSRSPLRIESRATGSAVPSCVNPSILYFKAELGAYSRARLLPAFCDGFHLHLQPPSDLSRVCRATQLHTDGVHR